MAHRLYLSKEWATDRQRRRKAGVPKEVTFKTKPAIALDHLRFACAAGLRRGVVLMDAGDGTDTALRGTITALGLTRGGVSRPRTIRAWQGENSPRAAAVHDAEIGRSGEYIRRRVGGADETHRCSERPVLRHRPPQAHGPGDRRLAPGISLTGV